MRFEAKHSLLKGIAQRGRNFKNLTYTITHRHQYAFAHHLYMGLYDPEVSLSEDVTPLNKAGLSEDEELSVMSKDWTETVFVSKIAIY